MDKNALLSDRMSGRTAGVDIEGLGEVTVRGLSRYEMIQAGKIEDPVNQERYILHLAMMDPRLTEEEVGQWQQGSPPDEINRVAMKVNELSGIGEGASKS